MEKILYVSPDGVQKGNGSADRPFASLKAARDWLRAQHKKGKLLDRTVRVVLRGGIYPIPQTLTFTAEDSGSPDFPVIWCAADGEEVILEGGAILQAADFVPVSDEMKRYIKSAQAREAVLQYDLRGAGLQDTDQNNALEFFCGDRRGVLARYPSKDFLRGPQGIHETAVIPDVTGVVGSWHTVKGVRIQGYYPIDYWRNEADIIQYHAKEHTFELTTNELRTNSPFIFYNVFDEISEPGEYYIDADTGMLYVYPDSGFATDRLTVSQVTDAVVKFDHASHIVLRGLTVEGSRGAGISGDGENLVMDGCTVRNVRECGVMLRGCGHQIINCHIYTIGASGVNVSGGDCETLRPAQIVVDNNHIHHYSQRSGTYNAGVSCSNFIEAGFRISHNCIHDSIHNAIMVASGDTFVEYNEIYNVCTEANDAGAIYFGRWEIQNLVFRYNYIHDVYNRFGFGTPHAIYNDDGGSGKVAYGNVMVHIAGDAFAFGGGNNNLMYNNIMVDCGRAAAYDSRQYYGGWEHDWTVFPTGLDWRFLYNNKSFLSRSWVTRYARMTTIKYSGVEDREDRLRAGAVGHAAYYGNVEVACRYDRAFEEPTKKFIICRDNVVYKSTADAGFADYEARDLNLRADSRIWRDLPFFAPIPFSEIGLRSEKNHERNQNHE